MVCKEGETFQCVHSCCYTPALKKGAGVYCFTSVCPSVSPSVPWIFFVAFFSGTTIQGFLKFGFRVYLSRLYCVMGFQIDHLTTSCLPNTCMILHMIAKLKNVVTFFSGTTVQGFLKFCFRIYISQLYRVMRFQIHHSTTSCLLNTCIIFTPDSQVENFSSHFSQELHYQDFWNLVSGLI